MKLTSRSVRKYDCALVVDVEGVGEEVMALPVSARCALCRVHVGLLVWVKDDTTWPESHQPA